MPRRCNDFVEEYLKYTGNTESPITYHLWACLSMISATLERRVCMRWGHTEIYPNQYIVLIGPSGARKGEPLTIARGFLEEVGINLIAEAITREALIRRMKNSISNYEMPYETAAQMSFQSAVTCVIEEMAVFLDNDPKFLADLTNWYDSRDKWIYETKHAGIDEVTGVCINILGSMAPDWIPLTIPPSAIGGGFTSRIIFVVEHRKGQTITNPNKITQDKSMKTCVLHDLEEIRNLSGEIIFHPKALQLYEEWYDREERRTVQGQAAVRDARFAGYVSRRATHIKKLCMAISAARSSSLVITPEDFIRSKALLEQVEINMPETFGRIGRSQYAEQTEMVLNYIKAHKSVHRREVMREFYRDIDGRLIEIIESTLQATGFVQCKREFETGSVIYIWKG